MPRLAGLPKYLKFMVCYGEASMAFRFPAASVAAGRYIGKGIYIVDLTGFKITMFTSEVRAFLKEFTAIFGDLTQSVTSELVLRSPHIDLPNLAPWAEHLYGFWPYAQVFNMDIRALQVP